MELNLESHLVVTEGCSLSVLREPVDSGIGVFSWLASTQPGVRSPASLSLPSLEVLRCEHSGILSTRGCQVEKDL